METGRGQVLDVFRISDGSTVVALSGVGEWSGNTLSVGGKDYAITNVTIQRTSDPDPHVGFWIHADVKDALLPFVGTEAILKKGNDDT